MDTLKKGCFIIACLLALSVFADKLFGAEPSNDLLNAIAEVESGDEADAVGDNGKAVGAYQIWKIYVDDVNRISKKNYTYEDRKSKKKSREMVKIFLNHYGGTTEEMARKHNGGPKGHKKKATLKYWRKIKAELEKK